MGTPGPKPLTVAELIAGLAKLPPGLRVVVRGAEGGYNDAALPRLRSITIDGNDPEASYAALQTALHYVRTERKPYLLEAMVSRLRGHSSASGANVVKDEVDCLEKFEATLEARKLIARDDIAKRRAAITQELLDASHQIRNEPAPSPDSIWEHVFADKNLVGGER